MQIEVGDVIAEVESAWEKVFPEIRECVGATVERVIPIGEVAMLRVRADHGTVYVPSMFIAEVER